MVIERNIAFALRCPTCGRLDVQHINAFQLSGDKPHELYCECGNRKASIMRKGEKYISITYYCIICDHEHTVVLPKEVFWSKNHLNSLLCLETDLNLGCFGPYKLIKAELKRQQEELNSMANELGFDDFANPEVILETLDYLHDIASTGGLFCECGSQDINIELFSDKLEISCNNCNSTLQIPASSRFDLDKLKSQGDIIIKLATNKSKNSRTHK
jgi:hypothetical protein